MEHRQPAREIARPLAESRRPQLATWRPPAPMGRLLGWLRPRPTAADVDLVVYDFDGVMTDNRVLTFQDGTEAVVVNRADGLGVGMLRRAALRQLILSTETNPVVGARGRKLGIPVMQSCGDKAQALEAMVRTEGIDLRRVLYVGNDWNDLEAMLRAGWPMAPRDANPVVKRAARVVLRASGGDGVALEIAEMLLGKR